MIEKLPARERELFEALYAAGEATAVELQDMLPDPPGNSAIRAMLSRLEKKGFVTHRAENNRFVYAPSLPERRVRQSAVNRFVQTYFKGSPVGAAAALIGMARQPTSEELDQLEAQIARFRKENP